MSIIYSSTLSERKSLLIAPNKITLPEQMDALATALFPLRQKIESAYIDLPWPEKTIQEIVVCTEISGGLGDIVAAIKAISVLQEICPKANFDWVVKGDRLDKDDSLPYLNLYCKDPSKIRMRKWQSKSLERSPANFLLLGPVKTSNYKLDYVQKHIGRSIVGPVFHFAENGADADLGLELYTLVLKREFANIFPNVQKIHSWAFSSQATGTFGTIPMGLQPGSGVFLDYSRMEAPLSRSYCCPSYLRKIQNVELQRDILKAMHVFDDRSDPNYDEHSFNFGYAHHLVSWSKFIDCVAIHEKNKHVVIVLNQQGAEAKPSIQQFQDQIFTSDRLAFLKQKGYGTIILKGQEPEVSLLHKTHDTKSNRCLTVIVRPAFAPDDMKYMQLAAERLLGTGDNSAVESWSARCILYFYEDVANFGNCKWRFLQQQVDLANDISPNLGRLLALFGGDRRLADPCLNKPLSIQKMDEIEKLLNDPSLSNSTLQFCQHATSYSFREVLKGTLKRTAWHFCLPQLNKIEAAALKDFYADLALYLKDLTPAPKTLSITAFPELNQRVHQAVKKYLDEQEQNSSPHIAKRLNLSKKILLITALAALMMAYFVKYYLITEKHTQTPSL